MAERTAATRAAALTGLVRKSAAPALIARTDIGMSPCPVMNTIGRASTASASRRWSSSPSMPGRLTSRTRHAGAAGSGRARNASAESKVSTSQPSARSTRESAFRTPASSSTTKTVSVTAAALMPRGGEGKVTQNVAPAPGPLDAVRLPLCVATID